MDHDNYYTYALSAISGGALVFLFWFIDFNIIKNSGIEQSLFTLFSSEPATFFLVSFMILFLCSVVPFFNWIVVNIMFFIKSKTYDKFKKFVVDVRNVAQVSSELMKTKAQLEQTERELLTKNIQLDAVDPNGTRRAKAAIKI